MIKHQKPDSFYQTFERKGPGQKVIHYCPGCGHGTAHKLLAEAISDLNIQDRVIFLSPVGCSVFAYYYFDTGNIQCAHGRAPAVATAVKRTALDSVVISYQGDGDLAGIGMGGIVHAANRGDKIVVIFINNAIYGMTGGQMAPTSLIKQRTMTTPLGRSSNRDGNPIGMCELIDSLNAPIYIERVSLGTPQKVLKARAAIRKAIKYQAENRGFAFVEVLSPCPVNWKMTPVEARKWLNENLEPVYPLKKFRDTDETEHSQEDETIPLLEGDQLLEFFNITREKENNKEQKKVIDQNIKVAGFGGQGVLSAGVLLANCAAREGINATWLPSYGPEMRGGTANASVILSNHEIGSPVVDYPNVLIAMNGPSLDAFEDKVVQDGLILVNSSLIKQKVRRTDVRTIYVPATEMASQAGFIATANVIMLAVYILQSKALNIETIRAIIPQSIKKKNYIDVNIKALEEGIKYYEEYQSQ